MTIGRHESQHTKDVVWLTPPHILTALGEFDLDPCAAPAPRPWPTAKAHIGCADGDGLTATWHGRVFLNPPYNKDARRWVARLADHGRGTALLMARTDTAWFVETVFTRATGLLFLDGRLHFCHPDGRQAAANAGAPSVLVAYGTEDARVLEECALPGTYVCGWTVTARPHIGPAQDALPFNEGNEAA